MPRVLAAIGVFVLLGAHVQPVSAQQKEPAQQQQQEPAIDVSKLPVAPARLQRKLQESIARDERDGVTLRYTVDVFALAPRLQLFAPEDNLLFGPTRFSTPTSQDMINQVTPQEFRSPIMDFSNMFRWLQGSKSDKK
jgi:hypothetical protein